MLFTLPPNMARMSLGGDAALPDMLARGQARPRIGRGGRLIFDRVSAITLEEFNTTGHSDEGVSPCCLSAIIATSLACFESQI